jgi:hypothetical protein
MADITLDVTVTGGERAHQTLARLVTRLDDGRPQLLGLLDEILLAQRERFEGKGTRWRKLKPSTLREKRALHEPDRILVATGRLMQSVTVLGAPDQVIEVRPGLLRFGTRVYYARFHHKGQGVPKRAVVGLTRAWRERLITHLRTALVED